MTGLWWKSAVVFLTSIFPIVESKGAIMLARLWRLPFALSGPLCALGSFIPVPFLLYRQRSKPPLSKKLWNIPDSLRRYVERYGCWALLLLISVPFTGMGCWLGALVARATHMEKKRAALCIFLGNAIAIALLTGCVHGLVTGVEKLLGLL